MTVSIYYHPSRNDAVVFISLPLELEQLNCSNWNFELLTLENIYYSKMTFRGFPGGTVVENLPANAGDTGSSPGLGRSRMPRSN